MRSLGIVVMTLAFAAVPGTCGAAALRELRELYPEARVPPITIAVGRGKPVGVGGRDTGVQIGMEALCATHWINPDLEDRFVRVIMHEYAHVQQAVAFSEKEDAPHEFLARSGWRPGVTLE